MGGVLTISTLGEGICIGRLGKLCVYECMLPVTGVAARVCAKVVAYWRF